MENREQIALAMITDILRRKRKLFVACWAVVFAASIAYAFVVTPVYRAELVLAPVESDSGGGGLISALGGQFGQFASMAGIDVGGDTGVMTHLALLESKEFTASFIEEAKLLPHLYADKWDSNSNSWKDGQEVSHWEVLEDFERNVRSVDYDSVSGLVRLRIDWTSGELAAEWANAMGSQLNRTIRERAIAEASDSVLYLKEELKKNNIVGIEQSIHGIIESQISKIMLANVRKDYAFQVIDPAISPSANARLRPNRPLIAAIGLVLGFVVAGFVAVVAGSKSND